MCMLISCFLGCFLMAFALGCKNCEMSIGSTLEINSVMDQGVCLVSPNGRFQLQVTCNGNLVVFDAIKMSVIWSAGQKKIKFCQMWPNQRLECHGMLRAVHNGTPLCSAPLSSSIPQCFTTAIINHCCILERRGAERSGVPLYTVLIPANKLSSFLLREPNMSILFATTNPAVDDAHPCPVMDAKQMMTFINDQGVFGVVECCRRVLWQNSGDASTNPMDISGLRC